MLNEVKGIKLGGGPESCRLPTCGRMSDGGFNTGVNGAGQNQGVPAEAGVPGRHLGFCTVVLVLDFWPLPLGEDTFQLL